MLYGCYMDVTWMLYGCYMDVISMGIPGSQNGGTVPYKAIFWVYIFLPYIALTQALYMIGTSDLGT